MSVRKRLRRADPARTAPIRDFSKLYRGPETSNGAAAAKMFASEKPRPAAATSPLAEGVELAYSVIEKYIAEGRRTAEGLSTQPYATRAANGNLQDLLERMLRFQAEILPLWVEALATLVKVEPLRNGHEMSPRAWPHSNGKNPKATTAMPIEVNSTRPVQVSVELVPNSDTQSLVALALSSVAPGRPALTKVSFVRDRAVGRVKLRVQIPDKQPAGTYAGVVVDRDSGEARGTLSVRLGD